MTGVEREREIASIRRETNELAKRMERHLDRLPPPLMSERIDRALAEVERLRGKVLDH